MSNGAAGSVGPASVRRRGRPEVWILAPTIILGAIGAVVGLIVGLVAHWQTAPFAMLEIGIPATVLGFLIGMIGVGISTLIARTRHAPNSRHT